VTPVHPSAALGFGLAADAYERGRPGYPQDAVDWIARLLGLGPGRTVLDLAAGTGKLTRQLVPTGAEVVAVEPDDAMRAKLQQAVPGVRALAGFAESIPLPDASVDAMTVAQGFHWFRPEAVDELHRVLRPGGGLALIWNTRDDSDPVQAEITRLILPLRRGEPAQEERRWRALLEAGGLFGPLEERVFPFEQEVDAAGLVDRVLSISFVAVTPPEQRVEIESAVRALAAGRPERFTLPHRTDVFVCYRGASATSRPPSAS
jgi:SAM-dependent methyltransferase